MQIKVSSEMVNRNSLSPTNNSESHEEQQQIQLTCGFCGVKCSSLETHIRQAHLHHLLFAGLLQNTFCHSAGLPNWQSLMPPPPIPALTPANDILQIHSSIPNGSTSPPSPKKAKVSKSPLIVSPTTPTAPQPTPLPLLCNQCSPSPAFHDFESFRIHLKSHLIASQQQQHQNHQISIHQQQQQHQCPYCAETIISDFESHLLNCHMGTVTTNYGCECCTKMFTKPDELQKHLMDIHAHHLYQCSLCRDMFDSKVSIQVHFAVKHSNECKLYKCNICGLFNNNEHDFKLHVKLVHFEPNSHLSAAQPQLGSAFPLFGSKAYYRCKYCSEEFNIEYLLDRHLEIEHSLQQKISKTNSLDIEKSLAISQSSPKQSKRALNHLKCEFCSTNNFKSSSELESHIKTEHKCGNSVAVNAINKVNNKCNICDDLFSSISELAEHKLKKHCIFGASECLECHANINSKDDYMKHLVEHNNCSDTSALNALFPVACLVCKQTLMSVIEIDLHANYHSNNRNTSDSIHSNSSRDASSPIVSESKLNSIKNDFENSNNSKTYDNNSKTYDNNNERNSSKGSPKLNDSIKDSEDITITNKRYQCIKCQKSFGSESEIKEHVHNHMMNEGSIQCKLCDKEFDTPAKLQNHLIDHNFNGGNEYSCHLCSIRFSSSQTLQTHMFDEHLNDRPFSCVKCLQKFWFPTELDNHSMAEHQDIEDDIDCDKCSEGSTDMTADDSYKCAQNGQELPQEFPLESRLKSSKHDLKHRLDNHCINSKRFMSNVCGKRFGPKDSHKWHQKSNHC
jgi:hypothetical protein